MGIFLLDFFLAYKEYTGPTQPHAKQNKEPEQSSMTS